MKKNLLKSKKTFKFKLKKIFYFTVGVLSFNVYANNAYGDDLSFSTEEEFPSLNLNTKLHLEKEEKSILNSKSTENSKLSKANLKNDKEKIKTITKNVSLNKASSVSTSTDSSISENKGSNLKSIAKTTELVNNFNKEKKNSNSDSTTISYKDGLNIASKVKYETSQEYNPKVIANKANRGKGNTCWDSAAKYHGVDPWLLYSIAYTESRFNPNAIGKNKNGTMDLGMMQINDKVWLPKLAKIGITKNMLKDPCVSIYVGAWILKQNINEFGYTAKAIGAYNSRTPVHNQRYAKKVYEAYAKFTQLYKSL